MRQQTTEAEEESLLKAGKNTSSASSKKKTSKISKKKSGIKKGSSKTLPVKTAASSGVGQGSTTTPTTEVPEGGYKDELTRAAVLALGE